MPRTRTVLACAGAAALLALAAGGALGNRLSVNDQDFVFTYEELEYEGGGISVRCPATLTGTFASSALTKTTGGTVGRITSARVDTPGCTGGDWIYLTETLPWTIVYRSFTGRLPSIQRIAVGFLDYSFEITLSTSRCLVRSSVAEPVVEEIHLEGGGAATHIAADPSHLIDMNDVPGGFLCDVFGDIQFADDGTVEDGQSNLLVVRLI